MSYHEARLRLGDENPNTGFCFSAASISETARRSVAAITVARLTSETEPQTTPTYYGWLDHLRGWLAPWVFISHSGLLPHRSPIADIGQHIVQMFALSGFLVAGILIRKVQSPANTLSTVPRFSYERWAPYFLLIFSYLASVTFRGPGSNALTSLKLVEWPLLRNGKRLAQHFPRPIAASGISNTAVGLERSFA